MSDLTIFLWLLKLGAVVNLYFFANTLSLPPGSADPHVVIPAQILFVVSGYRCLFPNRYAGNVVLHATPLSSTLVTRVLATVTEVAWIYQFSHVLRLMNVNDVGWIEALSWLMVFQVVVSQGFVWGAILTGRRSLYFYEEIGWAVIFVANTVASATLYLSVDGLGGQQVLLQLSLLFGLVYLPWQTLHLRSLLAEARRTQDTAVRPAHATRPLVADHLKRALLETNRRTDAEAWGGLVGLSWMAAYWATLIPLWVHEVVRVVGTR